METYIRKGFTIGAFVFVALVCLILTAQTTIFNMSIDAIEMRVLNSIVTSNWTSRIITIENVVVKFVNRFFDAQ